MSILSTVTSIFSTATSGIYKWAAGIGLVLAFTIGSYFYGVHVGDLNATVTIDNFKTTYQKNQTELATIELPVLTKIITQYDTKVVHVKDSGVTNAQIITKIIPDHEYLSNAWVSAHNSIATGEPIDASTAVDGSPSTFTAVDALSTININYTACNKYIEEVKGLQAYINGYNAAINKVNADRKK